MKNLRGFTLLELMVGLALVAIVTTIAAPSWQTFVANRRASGASRDIYNSLQHTRMAAINQDRPVSLIYMVDEDTEVSGASGASPKEFTMVALALGSDMEKTMVVDVPKAVFCSTNQDSMSYNARGILLATNQGTVRVWSDLTHREYNVVVNILGTLRQASGPHQGVDDDDDDDDDEQGEDEQ